MRDLRELDKFRDFTAERDLFGSSTDETRRLGGLFYIPTKGSRRGMKVIASSGEIKGSQGWDHVSVSLPNRCPGWEEMCKVKDLFFLPEDVCFQIHPAKSENISNHNFCLHIWRNIQFEIPLPPSDMVGIKDMGSFTEGKVSKEDILHQRDLVATRLLRS